MTDTDTEELRAALAAAKKEAPPWARLEQAAEFWCVANPERIARLLDALDEARKDAKRYSYCKNVLYADDACCNDAAIDAAMKEAP